MSESKIRVGITHGDPNGIGYEVILKIFADPRMAELCTPILYGSSKCASFYRKRYENRFEAINACNFHLIPRADEALPKRLNLIDCCGEEEFKVEPGVRNAEAGKLSLLALQSATKDLKAGNIDAIVTAPICKENIHGTQFEFTGHTEFFANEFGGEPLMLMCSELLKVGLTTIHIPITQVARAITQESILSALRKLQASLTADFSIRAPRIAVLGLNPHIGDGGVIGTEEGEIITPAIQEANKAHILAFGPFAADGFFASAAYNKYDAVLAMYHDQGLAPFKALSEGGVNFTAGLDVVRTSPAHGVGFDIAGKGVANEAPMREAIYAAIDALKNRKIHQEITANPLQKFKREYGKDISASELPDQGHA